jgi:hypothetical protein
MPKLRFCALLVVAAGALLGAVSTTQAAVQLEAPQLLRVTNLSPNPGEFEPQFSWDPVLGAAKHEVEVNSGEDFPSGSRWCCNDPTIATSLTPTEVLANNAYHWRVRAIDASGNDGAWSIGPSFTKIFDGIEPSISGLTVRNTSGESLSGVPTTDAPVVTWAPAPGASRYEVQVVPHSTFGCDWSQVAVHTSVYQAETATTAWTPLDNASKSADHIGPTAWPPAQDTTPALPPGLEYCLRVLARSDNDAKGAQVVSDWTQINGLGTAAFTYASPPPPGEPQSPFVTPATAYLLPQSGTVSPRTPWFSWNRVSGARGYYVVVARDAGFTEVADVGFTNAPAYALRLANGAPLSDQTTAYDWAVIPGTGTEGSGVYDDTPQDNSPQTFNKSSQAPTPLAPADGAEVSGQPTFRWSAAENARNYQLQVSQDPTFGKTIDDVTTDETAYTSSTTYPPNTVLYWRVRADDWIGQGLNWSAVQTFTKRQSPTVATEPASSVTQSSATLNATVNPNHETVSTCKFEYSPTESYGFIVQCASQPGSGESAVAVSASVTGLAANTTYHFRIVATNSGGTSQGSDKTFTTLPNPPSGSAGGGFWSGGSAGGGSSSGGGFPSSGDGPVSVSPARIEALLVGQLKPLGKQANIAALLESGGFAVVCEALEGGTAVIDWYQVPSGAKLAMRARPTPVVVAAGQHTFSTAATATIKIKLTAAGRRLLEHTKRLKLTAKGTFTPTGKTPITTTKVFVLKH